MIYAILLKINVLDATYFSLDDEDLGEKGDWIIAISNAFKVADKEEPLSATLGVISLRTTMEARLNRRDVAYKGKLILIDPITSNPGAGGGVIVTLQGKLVGMIGKIINDARKNHSESKDAVEKNQIAIKDEHIAKSKSVRGIQIGIKIYVFFHYIIK